MGLSLLTVALESGSHHIGTFPSLMNYVKDDMCKNLFWVGILWKSEIEANSGLGKGKRRLKYKTMKKKTWTHSFACIDRRVLGVSWCCRNYCWLVIALWCGSIFQCLFSPLYCVIVNCTCLHTKKLLSVCKESRVRQPGASGFCYRAS